MSETSGPMTSLLKHQYAVYDLRSAGVPIGGTEGIVLKTDPKSDSGELCFRGRNIFMGYLKNERATKETIDNSKRVHSGDEGLFTKDGLMLITGRIKELIVTAAGENVAPVIIETYVKEELPFLSNVMAIGDQMKYISAILTFKVESPPSEQPSRKLSVECREELEKLGVKGLVTVEDAAGNVQVQELIKKGIDRANKKAVSNAAKIKSWIIIPDDFSIPGNELTPTLKLKRNIVVKKYAQQITDLYSRPEL